MLCGERSGAVCSRRDVAGNRSSAGGNRRGVAAGGTGVAIWLWLSSLLELGADPVGLADQNPGATDTMPHGVTTAGMVVALLALVVTGVLAIIDRRPAGQPPGAPQP